NLLSIYSASIGVADFNGDGKLDLAVTNSEGSTNAVAIVLGNADGTLQNPPLVYSAGLLPTGLVTLDLNGDGKPDLAVAGGYGDLSSFSLTTLINRGDGTFANPVSFPVLQFPYSAVVGDFNGDGHVDISTTSLTQTGGVSLLLGKGDGTFQAHLDSATGQSPTAISAGDFNGDGKPDLAVATDNGIAILLGNGDGTFQPFSLVPSLLSYDPGDDLLALADFNSDGKLDIIKSTQPGIINVALGNGDGT